MIKSSDLFHIPFYDKARFTGSCGGMRFCIEKITEDDTPRLKAWIYPGPLCFDKTPDEQKESELFEFSEDGLSLIADWLNSQYESRTDYWNRHKSLLP